MQMNIDLRLVDDNPYNPRTTYPPEKISELAKSIKSVGLLEIPRARPVEGRYQLAFGHMRKRSFAELAIAEPDKYGSIPLEVCPLTDDDMFYSAVEENLKRTQMKPIELARGIDAFLRKFPNLGEAKVGKTLGIAQATVSNMRRVLALPTKILDKIDDDVINFSMARELLVLKDWPSADVVMTGILSRLEDGRFLKTVEGIQSAIHEVAKDAFKSLDEAEFDQESVGCAKCEHKFTTHPSRGKSAHWCMDATCWDLHTREHLVELSKLAAAAQAEEAERKRDTARQVPTPHVVVGTGIYRHYAIRRDEGNNTWYVLKDGEMVSADHPSPEAAQIWIGEHAKPAEQPVSYVTNKGTLAERRAAWAQLGMPCATCGNGETCDRSYCHVDTSHDNEMIVDKILICERHRPIEEPPTSPPVSLSKSNEQLAKEAEAYRKARADGMARRTQEHKAIKEALDTVEKSKTIPKSVLMLVLLAQMTGSHIDKNDFYYDGWGKSPEKWLWDKVSSGTEEAKRKPGDLFKKIYKMSDGEVARLATDMMFFYLKDHGGAGAYQIKTKTPLTWFGVDIDKYQEKAQAPSNETADQA